MRASLHIEAGQGMPTCCELQADRPATLGRNRTNTVVLLDEHASRWHAEVYLEEGHWFVRDYGTLNGTRVNGERIQQPTPLEPGQAITIGNTRLRFVLADEPPTNGVSGKHADSNLTSSLELTQTTLCVDELTALCQFMAASVEDTDARGLILRALRTVQAQTHAQLTGFLSLDQEDPLPKLVYPETAQVDMPLSRHLTREVERLSRAVWLGGKDDARLESDSLVSFQDALCVPLRAGDAPLGALHAYRSGKSFTEKDVRFCEVLAGHLANSLRLMRARRTLEAENSRLRGHSTAADQLIGDSAPLRQLRALIAKVAPRPSTVLITGESGVGKELVALALHRQSPRRQGPLVVVNCAAMAPTLLESELFGHCKGAFTGASQYRPGLFEQADEGTLFLDEVGELPLECQAKLLRVIEGKGFRPVGGTSEVQVDVRIIAATHRDLQHEVQEGNFRQDLFYRLTVIQIAVPPLREHADDIPALIEYFLQMLAVGCGREVSLGEAALTRLQGYAWPGNVRQLRSVLENALALCDGDVIAAEDLLLPAQRCGGSTPVSLNLEELEAWAIRQSLQQCAGNLTHAARVLGINRDTLRVKCLKLGIKREETE